jgi:hypothetical protein
MIREPRLSRDALSVTRRETWRPKQQAWDARKSPEEFEGLRGAINKFEAECVFKVNILSCSQRIGSMLRVAQGFANDDTQSLCINRARIWNPREVDTQLRWASKECLVAISLLRIFGLKVKSRSTNIDPWTKEPTISREPTQEW